MPNHQFSLLAAALLFQALPLLAQTAWTWRASGTTWDLNSVTWTGSGLLAVGDTGTVLTSSDGIKWTARTSGATQTLSASVWTGNQFVAVGGELGGRGKVLTSPDGIEWTARDSVRARRNLHAIVWSRDRFIASGLLTSMQSSHQKRSRMEPS